MFCYSSGSVSFQHLEGPGSTETCKRIPAVVLLCMPERTVFSFQHIPCISVGGSFSHFCWDSCPQHSFTETCKVISLTSLRLQLHQGSCGWCRWNDLGLMKINMRIATETILLFFPFNFREPHWSEFCFDPDMKLAKKTQPGFSKFWMTGQKWWPGISWWWTSHGSYHS